MTIAAGTGFSRKQSSFQAALEAAGMLADKVPEPGFIIVFASVFHDHDRILEGIHEVFGRTPVIGCSSYGELSDAGMNDNSVVVAGFMSDDIRFGMGIGHDSDISPEKAGENALKCALNSLGSSSFKSGFFFPEMIGGNKVLNSLKNTSPDKLFFGGCASGNRKVPVSNPDFSKGFQYFNDRVYQHSVPILLLDGNFECSFGVGHGWRPLGKTAKVGKTKKNIICDIDGLSSQDFYRRYLGDSPKTPYPLGFYEKDFLLLRAVAGTSEDGGLVFTSEIPGGTDVRITRGDRYGIYRSTEDTVNQVLADLNGAVPKLAIVISCISRRTMLGSRVARELDIIQEVLGKDVPLIGGYCAGEFAPVSDISSYHNFSFCLCVIGEREDGEKNEESRSVKLSNYSEESRDAVLFLSSIAAAKGCKDLLADAGIGTDTVIDWTEYERLSMKNSPRVVLLDTENAENIDRVKEIDNQTGIVILAKGEEKNKLAYVMDKWGSQISGFCYYPFESFELRHVVKQALGENDLYNRNLQCCDKLAEAQENLEEAETRIEVTEKVVMQSYEEIKAINDYTKRIIESITDALVVTDEEGTVRTVNLSAMELFGSSKLDYIGSMLQKLIPENIKSGIYRKLSQGRLYNYESIITGRNGEKIPILLSGSIIKGGEEASLNIVYIIKNIADRKAALEALYESEERFKQVTENAGEWIWEIDSNGLFTFSNSLVREILGYTEKEIVNKKYFYEFIHPEEREELARKAFDAAFNKESLKNVEYTGITKDGRRIILESTSTPVVDENGDLSGYRGSAKDITKRVAAEDALENAMKQAEAASMAKSQFLANMSHEIRTPMNAVLGFTRLLTETDLDSIQKDYLSTIKESGDILLTLINDVLDVSKIESGELVLEKIGFNLKDLAGGILKIISSRCRDNNIKLIFNYQEDMPRLFTGDPTRIKQILLNLLGNAVKFTHEGEIELSVCIDPSDNKTITQKGKRKRIINVSVRDTGIGIPESEKEKIFESFVQADTSVTRKYGGSGLGLAISRALIETMGGAVSVKSRENAGSNFVFTLVLEESDADEIKTINPVHYDSLKNKKVIVVDEDQRIKDAVFRYCADAGMLVTNHESSISDAAELFDFIHREAPDLVLISSTAAKNELFDIAGLIRKGDSFSSVPLLAISSDPYAGQARELEQMGYNGFLSRPFSAEEFYNVVCTILGDQRERGQIITRYLARDLKLPVLIVEDNEVNIKLVSLFMKKLGCSFEIARNGKEAVEMVAASDYQLILMDMQMPVMDGATAVEIIRNDLKKKVPIIALSAAVRKEDRERAFKAGMNDYLMKPLKIDDLKMKIYKWTGACRHELS